MHKCALQAVELYVHRDEAINTVPMVISNTVALRVSKGSEGIELGNSVLPNRKIGFGICVPEKFRRIQCDCDGNYLWITCYEAARRCHPQWFPNPRASCMLDLVSTLQSTT